jgi:hypothetical protein
MGALPQMDLSDAEIQLELANFSAVMMKLQVVGEPETVQLAGEVLSDYGASFLACLPKAAQIQMELSGAATEGTMYGDTQVQIKRVLAEMTALNESGTSDPERFQRLQRSFEFFSQQASDSVRTRGTHQRAAQALRMQYLRDIVPMMKSLNAKYVPLMVAIRHELGFGGELDHFQQLLERQISRVETATSKLLQELEVLQIDDPQAKE